MLLAFLILYLLACLAKGLLNNKLFILIASSMLILTVVYVLSLYVEDYHQMRKANAEYSLLKETFLPGMEKDEVLNKLNGHGYEHLENRFGRAGVYYSLNSDDIIVGLKSGGDTSLRIIFHVTRYPFVFQYPSSIKLLFDDDNKLKSLNMYL